ncbi:tryptophan--tRNA ligase, partial [Candidatus Saccharibacteria bacterium]|nr:tryptophan--tRNA ligase [Candidatus Saccharibacteria bacterium]
MERMTQFKDKSAKLGTDRVTVGLFDYPVLMACDILLYGAEYVPVGDDQSQHIEITRDLGERINNKFGELFTLPYEVAKQHEFFGKDQGLRIKDLADPTKKMSKSDDSGKGIIFLSEDPKATAKKVMSATTDSVGVVNLDYDNQPGISNLLQILALFTDRSLDDVAREYQGQTSYGDLKKDVAEATEAFLTQFQAKYQQVDMNALEAKLVASEAKMNEIANATLLKVQTAIGLR